MALNKKNEEDIFAGLFSPKIEENTAKQTVTKPSFSATIENDQIIKADPIKEESSKQEENSTKKVSEAKEKKASHKVIIERKEKEPEKLIGRPKSEKETKKRTSMAFYPSVYSKLEMIAFVDREPSVNAIVDRLLEEYIEKNKEKLQEYDRIIKAKVKH